MIPETPDECPHRGDVQGCCGPDATNKTLIVWWCADKEDGVTLTRCHKCIIDALDVAAVREEMQSAGEESDAEVSETVVEKNI